MLTRRVSAVTIAALLGSLLLAVPAQALIVIDDGGGGGGGGGSTPAAITLDDQTGDVQVINTQIGSSVNLPTAQWTGHTFTGWWTASAGGTKVTSPHVVTGSATYYAQWTPNSYTVTFQPANGAGSTATTADYDTTISAPAQPSRANYVFAGWFTSLSGGTQVTFPYTVLGDATLYAHWTGAPRTVTFEPGNGDAAIVDSTQFGAALAAPTQPTRSHYAFLGWFTAASGGTQVTFPYSVTSNATLYAQWELDSHTVTFEPGNGSGAQASVEQHGTSVSAPAQPSRPHYSFDGWFTAASGGTQATFPYTVTGDVTFYAQWTIDTHTVTFDPENGEAASSAAHDYGTSLGAPATPVLANHQFDGWFTAASGGTEIMFPYTVTGDVTLYAQWTIDTHTVTFEPENGEAASSAAHDYGTSIGAPATPVLANHQFDGWFTAASGGTEVAFPYTVTGDVTLYAQWTIDTHTVTFAPGNGDAAVTASAAYDSTLPAPAEPSRPSHTFVGWFTAEDGGTEVAFPLTVTGDVTLYAHWERVSASFDAPDQVTPGATVTITGENFIPGESVEIWLLSTPVKLATVVVGADGTFATTVVIPTDTPAGAHHLELRGTATETLSTAVEVTEVLSATGADIHVSAALAAVAMLVGLALLLWRRRLA